MSNNQLKEIRSVINRFSYKHYNNYFKKNPKKYRMSNREEWFKFCNDFLEVVAENIVDREAGVMLKGFGYFFVWRVPKKMQYSLMKAGKEKTEHYSFHTDNHMYSPIFQPLISPANYLRFYSMDNAFSKPIKKGISKKLKNGESYKNYVYTYKKLYNKT